jgi:hypothetical protein
LEYSTQLFNRSTIEDLAKHYIEILQQVVENRDIKLNEIKMSYDLISMTPKNIEEDKGFCF